MSLDGGEKVDEKVLPIHNKSEGGGEMIALSDHLRNLFLEALTNNVSLVTLNLSRTISSNSLIQIQGFKNWRTLMYLKPS